MNSERNVLDRDSAYLQSMSVSYESISKKFPDWVDNEINNSKTLIEKQHKGLWRQNLLDWLIK
jgi:hypothetical protein